MAAGYAEIAAALRSSIEQSMAGWEPGAPVPSESRLSAEWGVNRTTIRRALGVLEADGLVEAFTGRGRFVRSESGVRRASARFEEIAEALKTEVAAGGKTAGDRLDSESKLQQRFTASQGTIRQALRKLREEGVLVSVQGRGWFVAGSPAKVTSRANEVAGLLRKDIHSGVLANGARLPGELALADEYQVSKGTMRRALAELEKEGLIENRPGRSRVVSFET